MDIGSEVLAEEYAETKNMNRKRQRERQKMRKEGQRREERKNRRDNEEKRDERAKSVREGGKGGAWRRGVTCAGGRGQPPGPCEQPRGHASAD